MNKKKKIKMDLLYCNPDTETRKLLENINASIEDASDCIHTERVAIFYQKNKVEEYKNILINKKIIGQSLSFLTGNL